MTYSASFQFCFDTVVKIEAGYTNYSADPGNWTSGVVGQGLLKGTKYGISAASYPKVDIVNLTQTQAEDIYYTDFWTPMKGDQLPNAISLIVFDGAVNQGLVTSIRALQSSLELVQDGNLGPISLQTINTFVLHYSVQYLATLVLRSRLYSYMQDSDYLKFKNAWIQRLFNIGMTAGTLIQTETKA